LEGNYDTISPRKLVRPFSSKVYELNNYTSGGVNEGKDILVLIRVNRAKTKRWIRVFERQQQFPMVQTLCGVWIRETESPPPALYPLSPP
jgi:hypothetical protein